MFTLAAAMVPIAIPWYIVHVITCGTLLLTVLLDRIMSTNIGVRLR